MKARVIPFLALALCLLLFYGPMLLSAGTVLTTLQDDPVAHMLNSLGDPRPGGRFFHYLDLQADTRLWAQDVHFHALHGIRLLSIVLGAGLAGWNILIMGLHALLFAVVYRYSRRVLRVGRPAALAGSAVAFFSLSWSEWVATAYYVPSAALVGISLGEYGLFLQRGKRRHLLTCILANALQPYLSACRVLIAGQVHLFCAVVLMAVVRREGAKRTILPWLLQVWPLTALAWLPILAPMLFSLGSGLLVRYGATVPTWGLDPSVFTGLLGLVCPVPFVVGDLLDKLGWLGRLQAPNNFLFGSFLLLPGVLALWHSRRRTLRLLMIGMALYVGSMTAAELIRVPSVLVTGLGFSRAFLFPLLSGFVVAAGIGLGEFARLDLPAAWLLRRLYQVIGVGAATTFLALCAVSPEQLAQLASHRGLIGSGLQIPSFLLNARSVALGAAIGLAGYLAHRAFQARFLRATALCIAIAAPTFGVAAGEGWYIRQPGLDAALSPPSEFRFLRERLPSYEYRVGVVLGSNLRLAHRDWTGFWKLILQRDNAILSYLAQDDLDLRQGLGILLPSVHFYGPAQRQLRLHGNPFLNLPEAPEGAFLNRRRAEVIDPRAESLEEYGVRYWVSNADLSALDAGKFKRVYAGEYAAVFENRNARPVAFLLSQPDAPLPLEQVPFGAAARLPHAGGGILSVHLDLRGMRADAMGPDGAKIPLPLEPSGLRWLTRVPPGCSAVQFTAREAPALNLLAAASGFAFFIGMLAIWGVARETHLAV